MNAFQNENVLVVGQTWWNVQESSEISLGVASIHIVAIHQIIAKETGEIIIGHI